LIEADCDRKARRLRRAFFYVGFPDASSPIRRPGFGFRAKTASGVDSAERQAALLCQIAQD
jgi:hypothetical protein